MVVANFSKVFLGNHKKTRYKNLFFVLLRSPQRPVGLQEAAPVHTFKGSNNISSELSSNDYQYS